MLVLVTLTSFGSVLLDALLPELARRGWHAIALDLMGYGRSDKRDAIWLVEDFADSIDEALRVQGVRPQGLVCGHFSSWIGIELASRGHDWPSRLVLDGTPYFSAAVRAANLAKPPAPAQAWTVDGAHALEYWKRAYGIVSRLNPDASLVNGPSTKFRQAYLAVLESLSFEPGTMQAANRFDLESKIARLRLPTLVMCSDIDWNLQHHATLLGMLPDAAEKRWTGIHPLHDFERPERAREYATVLDAFFRAGPSAQKVKP